MSRPVIALFAGSSTPKDPAIMAAAEKLGRMLGAQGFDLIYGAGTQGVMGAVAKAAAAAGSHITAVVLDKYAHEEQIAGATLIKVASEQERFALLSSHGNPVASLVMPGGPGALREALQGLEKAVYENGAPLVLVDIGNYLSGIRQYFAEAVAGGLIREDRAGKLLSMPPDGDLKALLSPQQNLAPRTHAPQQKF
ncbi:MAG: LOG family protein [Alphaproteobacteria bacterium]|nr:LOG family protein [Alphaproteobacteria bacterium]